MKKALTLLVVALTVGTVRELNNQAIKINSMIKHTSVVSQNDSSCSNMDAIISLYKRDNLLKYYDNHDIKVYVYHELDSNNFSHNEIEINFTHYSLRYDL